MKFEYYINKMKFEKFDQEKEPYKGFYILPVVVYGYGPKGKALCFGWLWYIWILWLSKKDEIKEK